ncbi:MAG TPA: tyrosine-type recombinase/integrase [Candidatus Krumholzibacteria bacterium]|nr:tyrosine-type recombinase/integrase [Candidatus Krumholzibacteria bacterium]HPD73286.1 tyrosine-type recombinase/integrase [Candidatus Krumholzibacteria bacterium]
MKLKEAVAQYLESLAADGRSPHTQGAYRRDLRVFVAFAGNVDLEAVTPAMLQKFMASRAVQIGPTGARRAKASVNRYRVTLKALFAWAEARWYVSRNPTRVLKCQRQRAVPRDILSDAEVETVLCAEYRGRNSLRDKAIVGFMLMTGCRLGETVALDLGDIDWSRQTVTLRSTKGGDPDRVPLSDRCLTCLAPCRPGDDAPPSTPLFRSSRGERLSTRQVQRIVEARLREAGILRHLTAHSLRHTFATRLYNNTGDIRLVQEALRHEYITTTQIYAHVDPQRLRSAVNA